MARSEMMRLLAAESPSLLASVEQGLLALERGEEMAGAVQSALRAVHTIFSGAALASCGPMEELAGGMEIVLRLAAAGELQPRQHHTDALLQAADVLAAMFSRLDELAHVETGGARRALEAALGAELPGEDLGRLKPQPLEGAQAPGAAWRVCPWLLEQKLSQEGLFSLSLPSRVGDSPTALYTRLGELLTLGEVLACAGLDSGELVLLYASPLEPGQLGEALSLTGEQLRPMGPAELGLTKAALPVDKPKEEPPLEAEEGAAPAPTAPAAPAPPERGSEPELPAPSQAPPRQYLVFGLGPEVYGVDIELAREIVTLPPITALPLSPEHVLGVMNLRGSVVPVFDLRCRLGLPPDPGIEPVIILLRLEGKLQGLAVDKVRDVIALPEDLVQEAPEMAGSLRRDYLRGLVEHGEEMIILLELERLLALEPVDHAA
ncbi:MAG: chemotaxis protein CheW [Desulfarculaceae bacterium]|nr:chemotaxis protein CheW [Desulfarculaceae bacterium]MCF8072333.1 chemotaxis protein CheW [Desulfarculaceae bacterium]MCF8100254.1 chemotaxis protein CheW [Desulfarculaceae bacterium]MCF8116173.1 chemotaxis protein CheW [Desulfarculaceae bacterium]